MKNQAKETVMERIVPRETISGRTTSGTIISGRTIARKTISGKTISGKTISKRSNSRRTENRRTNKKVEMQRRRSRSIICASIVCSILMVAILFSVVDMNANAKTVDSPASTYKYYASVQIMNGDSLWSIAEEYTDGSIQEILHCIDEIKSINHLSRFEKIKAGEFLIVPYYSEDIL